MSILTINKDGTPSYNEVNYVLHELEDSRIKRHILSGIITDMEVSDIGAKNTNCRVRYKNQSVLIQSLKWELSCQITITETNG